MRMILILEKSAQNNIIKLKTVAIKFELKRY